jgi:hypothetical protein
LIAWKRNFEIGNNLLPSVRTAYLFFTVEAGARFLESSSWIVLAA